MFSRQVGLAFALQGAVLLVATEPASFAISDRFMTASLTAPVVVAVRPLDLGALDLADFGDVEPAR